MRRFAFLALVVVCVSAAWVPSVFGPAKRAALVASYTASPVIKIAEESRPALCGKGTGVTCWKRAVPYQVDAYPGPSPDTGDFEEALYACPAYYDRYIETSIPDLRFDWYCYERQLKPVMVPDLSR